MHGPIEMPQFRKIEIHLPRPEERERPVERGAKPAPVEPIGTPEQIHFQKVQIDLQHGISSVDTESLRRAHEDPVQLAEAITKNLTEEGALVRYDPIKQSFSYSDKTIKEAPVQINQFHKGPSIIGASPETLAALHAQKELQAPTHFSAESLAAASHISPKSATEGGPPKAIVALNEKTAAPPPTAAQVAAEKATAARIAAATQANLAAEEARKQAKTLEQKAATATITQTRAKAPTEQPNRPKASRRLDRALEFAGEVGAKASQKQAESAQIASTKAKIEHTESETAKVLGQLSQQAHMVNADAGSSFAGQEGQKQTQANVNLDAAARELSDTTTVSTPSKGGAAGQQQKGKR